MFCAKLFKAKFYSHKLQGNCRGRKLILNIPIALQLYSVREDCAHDFRGTLSAVANMGYTGVEFAGYHGRSADELKTMLDSIGLKVAGSHVKIESLLGDELHQTIKFNKKIGNHFLIVPGLPKQMRNSKAAWLKTAQLMNKIAEEIRPERLRVGYHNHPSANVFHPIDGALPWDLLFQTTTADVLMQIDCGNAMREGVSADKIIDTIKQYRGRAVTVHLKEYSATNNRALIGEGEMKWRELFNVCETIGGTEWYIIEQENSSYPPLEAARRCAQNFISLHGSTV